MCERNRSDKKVTTIVADDPDVLTGRRKRISGSQSDHWNNTLSEKRDTEHGAEARDPLELGQAVLGVGQCILDVHGFLSEVYQ